MAYQSLYRRYRPQRFDEVVGQDHVSRTLRSAVRDARVTHAYLFSGPRGTGKTSTARILAKALNCAAPDDGEPCGRCDSCVQVAAGSSLDVHELDAASNNGVDAMRDLVARAALGTSGRWKVYIVDEVHMLSAAASNALLKTLEEPPGHVIFVLATTDPQKVLPTIRSRTQHFEFRLLPTDVLTGLVSRVAADAELEVPPGALDAVVRRGAGSARDALSALDQVAAAGSWEEESHAADAIVEALCDRDAGRALVAVAEACGTGRDPRQLARDVVEHLRQVFLQLMASELVSAPDDARPRLADQAQRLGPPATVRGLEVLGEALVDMRDAVDPRITLEVALVRLARADADASPAALLERIERLERSIDPSSPPAPPTPAAGDTASGPAASARAALGSARPAPARARPAAAPPPPRAAAATPAPEPTASPASGPLPSRDDLTREWGDRVMQGLRPKVKALFAVGRFVDVEEGRAVMALPNAPHRDNCEKVRGEVEQALAACFGRPVPLRLVVDSGPAPPPAGPAPHDPSDEIDIGDPAELRDAPAGVTSGLDRLTAAFPGAELVDE